MTATSHHTSALQRLCVRGAVAFLTLAALLVSCAGPKDENGRQRQLFNNGWRFILSDSVNGEDPRIDITEWRKLNLPHDWAIEGDFDEANPSGIGCGALPGGIGWYAKNLTVSDRDLEGKVYIDFDGVYMNSTLFVNGYKVGNRPNGYVSMRYDITPFLQSGRNRVAVKVDNSEQPNSRWYSGCGIYRNVYITKTQLLHVSQWGINVTTPLANNQQAKVLTRTTVSNELPYRAEVTIAQTILDAKGFMVDTKQDKQVIEGVNEATLAQSLSIPNPKLWSVNSPYLYTLKTEIIRDSKVIDTYLTHFGARGFYFDSERGFILNDSAFKINGVCLHHDLGCLGAAINKRAIERQLQILKEMGCNAIRCSHNPPATEFLDLCDSLGFLVMDEAFDVWRLKKTEYDYARDFAEWYERDLTDMVKRDRNHPCVIMWSIGNEVLEQWTQEGTDSLDAATERLVLNKRRDESLLAKSESNSVNARLCRELAFIVRSLDDTRPIIAGNNNPKKSNHLFQSNALDIIGYNYQVDKYMDIPKMFHNKPFLITESVSALMTRGYYRMPSHQELVWPKRAGLPFKDMTMSCSSYDNCHTPWGSSHEQTWSNVKNLNFISGQFVWSGFDYIGEPTPFGWPARSSFFGIVDLAGFPKDIYYMYQSEWRNDKNVLHLFPHWNWKDGQEVDVWCYYNNADEVELLLNGESMGVDHKDSTRFHASWTVTYKAGEIKAISRKGGKVVAEKIVRTALRPVALRLTPDRTRIKADGTDLSFITVEVVDKYGTICPNAEVLIEFETEGVAFIAGVDNGSPISLERFKDNKRKSFYGKALVVLQSNGTPGICRLKATSENIKAAEVTLNCVPTDKY